MDIISKQLACQKFIYKIHSSRLRKEKWKLVLPIDEARKNDEIISLADSQVLRWIDELNGIRDADKRAKEIKSEIKRIRKADNNIQNRRLVKKLYTQLDELQYKPDYMCLVIDKEKDYYRACKKGFSINGIKYKRLLGTNGGIKNSTIVFVSEDVEPELTRRINNGRDQNKELVTAKLEAYKALTCSASIPVSLPKGVLVVDDCNTEFISDIVYLTDEGVDEPIIEDRKNERVEMDASDGCGLMLPSLASRWSNELGLDYIVSGVNTRFSFEKGMVFTFDFLEFADKIAHKYIVKDAWGNDVDIRNVELILTTSMVKLYDSYKSCEDYIQTSINNGYTFGVAKTCPKELERERNLNYQFIQSYDLEDDDIEELIKPTMDEIRDVLGGDWRKTVLFLKGAGLNENNIESIDNDFVKALMIDQRMIDDPFVQNSIFKLICNRINEAKVGVLKVHGNYSIVSGDPYALCQSIFNLQITGLLKSGEIYNKYWADYGSDTLACFRAPMTCHNNIRKVIPVKNDEVNHWYQYMNTCTIFNAWDTTTSALNGCDFDGDLVMLTDNNVLVNKLNTLPALMCAQRRAAKKISTEDDFIISNIESFGNDIGQTTNWITSMFEVRAGFDKNTKEYDTLSYRIKCGQLYQQNAIDKAKGIVCKPMPKNWHDRHTVNKIEDDDKRNFYKSIVADKKPYFMKYIYPNLMRQYNTYIKNTNKNALREFQLAVPELYEINESKRTSRQKEFLKYYELRMPVGLNDCVMNKICRRFENEFDGYIKKQNARGHFDYSIMKNDMGYTPKQYNAIKKIYEDYNKRLASYAVFANYERVDDCESFMTLSIMNEEFKKECSKVCSNKHILCNIILDICYTRNSTKRFAWNMCGEEIIHNLLSKNNYTISYPVIDDNGYIDFYQNYFVIKNKTVGGDI